MCASFLPILLWSEQKLPPIQCNQEITSWDSSQRRSGTGSSRRSCPSGCWMNGFGAGRCSPTNAREKWKSQFSLPRANTSEWGVGIPLQLDRQTRDVERQRQKKRKTWLSRVTRYCAWLAHYVLQYVWVYERNRAFACSRDKPVESMHLPGMDMFASGSGEYFLAKVAICTQIRCGIPVIRTEVIGVAVQRGTFPRNLFKTPNTFHPGTLELFSQKHLIHGWHLTKNFFSIPTSLRPSERDREGPRRLFTASQKSQITTVDSQEYLM